MDDQQRSRWQPTGRQLLWACGIAALAFVIFVICSYQFGWKWTGLPERTLWDWLELLIVPAILAAGGLWFNHQQRKREMEIAEQRAQDEALQAYLDDISQMLTNKDLPLREARASQNDDLSTVARARTLTVFSMLGSIRKRSGLQFVYESGLINKGPPRVVDLKGADLSGAYLRKATLNNADLSRVDLSKADLFRSYLFGAELSRANLFMVNLHNATLREVNLNRANLSRANLSKADLSRATLYRANLFRANLSDANLSGADLTKAYMEGTTVTQEQLTKCKSLQGATLPNGKKYEDWVKDKEVVSEKPQHE